MTSAATHQHGRFSRIGHYRWRNRFGDRFADYRISPLQHGQCECGPYAHFRYFQPSCGNPRDA